MKQFKIILRSGNIIMCTEEDYSAFNASIQSTSPKRANTLVWILKDGTLIWVPAIEAVQEAFRSGYSGILKPRSPEQDRIAKEQNREEKVGSLGNVLDKNKPDEMPKV